MSMTKIIFVALVVLILVILGNPAMDIFWNLKDTMEQYNTNAGL